MRKLMFLMMALLVAPAMAAVEITLVEVEGECAVDLVITATGDDAVAGKSLVAGIAVTVSVEAGEEITSVTNYMETGVSEAGALGYGIYMGTITFTGGDPEAIDQVGTPVAPDTAPDAPGQLPGESCVLEFGGLYDVANPDDAPDAVTTLARINLAGAATVTVTEEIATRGGIVNIGGDAPSGVTMPDPTAVSCGPACWNYPCYPYGDANGDNLISALDVKVLLDAWGGYDPCADFNKDEIVSALDVKVLLDNWGTLCP